MTMRIHRQPGADTALVVTDNGLEWLYVRAEKPHPRHAKDPTPEEIAERSAEIRAEWDERQLRVRAGILPGGLEVMVISTAELGRPDPAAMGD